MGNDSGSTARRPTPRTQRGRSQGSGTARTTVGATTRRVSSRTAAATRGATARRSGGGSNGPSSRHVLALVVIGVAAVAAVGLAVFGIARCSAPGDAPNKPANDAPAATGTVEVEVPEGSSGDQIAQAFVDAGLVKDLKTFYAAVSAARADNSIQAGTYEFKAGTSVEDIVAQLVKGPNSAKGRVTVAEGLTVAKTADVVEAALGIPAKDFMAQAKASNYVDAYPFLSAVADDSLEGFLWGSTYDFTGQDVTADTVIRAMLDEYQKQTASIDFAAGEQSIKDTYGIDMDDYDIVILASIIERETPTDADRPNVASVGYNRMKAGMPLQVDATTEYVVGREVTPDDLKEDNAYNTYLHKGLPPTPICSPSKACIDAALNPASTGYLYFLIIENGTYSNHTFSETYEQHLAAIEQAKRDQGIS